MRSRAVFVPLLLLLGGCAQDVGPTSEMILGLGATELTRVRDGDPVDVYMGPQGGIHLFASILARGIAPGDRTLPRSAPEQPVAHYTVTRGDDVIADMTLSGPLTAVEGNEGWFELVGVTVRLFPPEADPPSPADVAGQTLVLEASLTDVDGHVAAASVTLIAREGM